MFRGSYQRKLLTILYSGGSNPLEIWDIQVKNGWTRRVKDEDMGTIVFEICGTNVATAYVVSPPGPRAVLAISLPFITMFIKNLKRYFTFEIQILDDKKMRRRFRFSNYQSSTKVRPFTCSVPLALKPGWNQMQLNLANFTMRAYGTNYMETQRVQIHANCRIRRIYFSDRLYAEEELPRDYRIYLNARQAQPQPAPPVTEEPVHTLIDKPTSSVLSSSSILKKSSIQKATDTVVTLSEMEILKTSFKSSSETQLDTTESAMQKSSLDEFNRSSKTKSVQSVKFRTESKHKVEETSSKTSIRSEAGKLSTEGSLTRGIKSDGSLPQVLESEIPVQAEELDPPEEFIVEGQVTEEGAEKGSREWGEQLPEDVLVQNVMDGPDESPEVEESPRTATDLSPSEFAESEPIPESDWEELPSSPEPETD